jgi:hypothetical protein
MNITRKQLASTLATGQFIITFTKVDGSLRTIRGTLSHDLLPKEPLVEVDSTKPARAPNESVATFYDLDKNEWRSCKLANIITVSLILHQPEGKVGA